MRPAPALCAAMCAAVLVSAAPVDGQPMGGGGGGPSVTIDFADYSPATIDVLAGDTVTWTNESSRKHTVTDDAGAFDSGAISGGATFRQLFDGAGSFPYHCRLHPYIRGEVDVHELLLDEQRVPAQSGQAFPLGGRAALPAGATVAIEADDGSGYRQVSSTAVGPDGHFTADVTPTNTASYRAVAGDVQSPPVQVLVLNHDITARVRNGRRASIVTVRVTPADPRSTVVLQLHLRERFGWWPVAQAKLRPDSTARFVLHLRRRVSARVRLTLPDGATPLATSPTLRVGR